MQFFKSVSEERMGILEQDSTGLQGLPKHISCQLCIHWQCIVCLKSATVGEFMPWESANATAEGLFSKNWCLSTPLVRLQLTFRIIHSWLKPEKGYKVRKPGTSHPVFLARQTPIQPPTKTSLAAKECSALIALGPRNTSVINQMCLWLC